MNHLNYLLKQILSYEPNIEDKLNMLTEIGIMTTNDQLFKATEEVRDELVKTVKDHDHPGHISNFQL